jgi:hypothetical protein
VPYSVKDCFELIIDSRRVTEVDSDVKKAKIIKHLTATTRVQQLKMKPVRNVYSITAVYETSLYANGPYP